MGNRATLQDIAKIVGVTPSTVQRALNGVEGVGQDKRAEIQKVADEIGYKRNYIASSLKRGSKKIVIVLPEPINNNRYYARFLWDGAKKCLEEFSEFNVETEAFTYVRNPENHAKVLLEAYEKFGDTMDGLLTMGTQHETVVGVIKELNNKNIPVALVGTDMEDVQRLCCVRTYDEMAGRMAADLLINFGFYNEDSKIILTGDLKISDQYYNAQGFEKHILENASHLELIKLSSSQDLQVVKEKLKSVIGGNGNICGIYSCSARNTVPMCQAVMEMGKGNEIRLIGSDIFPESIDLVKQGTLNAIIHKRPFKQAYTAMQVLVGNVVKGQCPQSDNVLVDSIIVMKSNVVCF